MEDLLQRKAARPDAALAGAHGVHADPNPGPSQTSVVDQLKALSARIEATKKALEAQDKRLDALRSCAEDLGGALHEAGKRVAKVEAHTQPLASVHVAAATPRVVTAASKPRFVLPAVEEEDRLRTRADVTYYPDTTPSAFGGLLRWAPYAAVAFAGLMISARVPWKAVSWKDRAVSIVQAAPPSAAAYAAPRALAPARALEPIDEQTVDDVLQLVYTYTPKGSRENVIEMLGPEIDASNSAAPWLVERGDKANTYHATLRPYGEALDEAPVYEFDVDLGARVVRALPTTEATLKGASVAASGR